MGTSLTRALSGAAEGGASGGDRRERQTSARDPGARTTRVGWDGTARCGRFGRSAASRPREDREELEQVGVVHLAALVHEPAGVLAGLRLDHVELDLPSSAARTPDRPPAIAERRARPIRRHRSFRRESLHRFRCSRQPNDSVKIT